MEKKTNCSMIRLPDPSVLIAGKIERFLRSMGLGRHKLVNEIRHSVIRRWLARHDLTAGSTRIAMNGVTLKVPSSIVFQYLDRRFDPLTTQRLKRYLKSGYTFVDVGAHIGYYSLLASRCVGQYGRVYSVEPSKTNLELLRENIADEEASNVTIHPFAAGENERPREFHITEFGDTSGFYRHPLHGTLEKVTVLQKPLDDLVRGKVHAVKIDVEGAEMEVLGGMRRILAENAEMTIIAEWAPACMLEAGVEPAILPEFLIKKGFHLTFIDEGRGLITHDMQSLIRYIESDNFSPSWFINIWAESKGTLCRS